MKTILNAESRKALQQSRAAIATELEALEKVLNPLFKTESEHSRITAEIASLESADDASDEAIGELPAKRERLAMLARRLASLEMGSQPLTANLRALLHNESQLRILPALRATSAAYEASISKLLRPYCSSQANAEFLTKQSDAVRDFGFFLTRTFASYQGMSNIVGAAKQCVGLIDGILAGSIPWEFNSQLPQ
jgi:hypothetical protein